MATSSRALFACNATQDALLAAGHQHTALPVYPQNISYPRIILVSPAMEMAISYRALIAWCATLLALPAMDLSRPII